MNQEEILKQKIMLEIENVKQKSNTFGYIKNLISESLQTVLDPIPVAARALSIFAVLIGFSYSHLSTSVNNLSVNQNYVDQAIYDVVIDDYTYDS